MAEKEKTEKFTNEEAIELVEKFKVLVEKYDIENGFLIHKFFAIPTKYYANCKELNEFEEVWKEQDGSLNRTYPDIDYEVVALHKLESKVFLYSNDVNYFEKLFHEHSNKL